jgi:hypothetical protein
MDTKTKTCSKCDNVKPLAEFYKNKRSPGGYRPNCKHCHNKVTAVYMQTDKYKAYKKKYDREQYYPANKDAIAKYKKERMDTDPLFKLSHNIRVLIRSSFRNGGFNKKSKTAEILGCTFKEYYKHIESQFKDGMSWQRMDDIHIDHRLPVSAANTEEELLVLNHHRNLQPMWATDNLAKSDSYCPDELAAYFKKHLPS